MCVARKTDKLIIASRTHRSDPQYDFVANVKKVLDSPGWATVTTDKLTLEDGPNMFYVLIDEVCIGCLWRSLQMNASQSWQLCLHHLSVRHSVWSEEDSRTHTLAVFSVSSPSPTRPP